MSSIFKGLTAENMRGFSGVGGRRNREDDEHHEIDARLAAQHAQRQEYEQTGKFWLKQKDTQEHISDEFIGKAAANKAALELLKQRPELKGNLVITAYGPGEQIDENLRKWFKEKWVRFGPDGKIRGDCARGDDSEGKPKCLPQSKAHSLGKEGRKYAASKKRREDPNPERSGKAINVATKKKSNEGVAEASLKQKVKTTLRKFNPTIKGRLKDKADDEFDFGLEKDSDDWISGAPASAHMKHAAHLRRLANGEKPFQDKSKQQGVAEEQLDEKCWDTHKQVGMKSKGGKMVPNCVPKESIEEAQKCPECGGPMFSDLMLAEKKDACYHKVRSRYKVWPSAYASGALVQCRKKGAKNWGNKSNEGMYEAEGDTLLDPEVALQQARKITKAIKYENTSTDIIVQMQMLAERTEGIDTRTLESNVDEVYAAQRQLESAVYGLEEAFEDAVRQAQYRRDDEEDLDEDYTGEFAAEKTVETNPYGGQRDRQFRGAISETPTDNPTGASGEGGWRTYKPKVAGTFKKESAILKGLK